MKKLALAIYFCILYSLNVYGQYQKYTFQLMEKSLFSDSRISIQVYVYNGPGVLESELAKKTSLGIWNIVKFKIHNKTNHQLWVNFQTIVDFIDGTSQADKIGGADPGLFLESNGDWPVIISNDDLPGFGGGHLTSTREYEIITQINTIKEAEKKLIVRDIRISNIQVKDITAEKQIENTQGKNSDNEKLNEVGNTNSNKNAETEKDLTKKENEVETKDTSKGDNTALNKNNSDMSSPVSKTQEQINYEAEQASNVKRQNEYEQWKSNYIQERAKLDAAAVASTATILYFLGGIIYKGMGNVNPSLVFHANQKGAKAKPKYYLNSQFGYSYSSVPFLYLSQISTMVNGKTITSSSFKGYDGFFLNLGGQFNIGFHSNYYSFYGNFGLLGGIEPTFKGSNFIFNYGGGGSIGSKPVKIYGRYRLNDMVDYSMKTGNVEEQNEINSKLSSKEYELGLQFTFGGGVKSNFKRTHLFLGLLQKEFDLPWGSSEAYFNFNKSVIQNFGKVQVKGYSFEIRKDHTFSFFTRYYPEHVYFGQVGNYNSANGTLPAKLEHPNNSFIELGIYRCLDAF